MAKHNTRGKNRSQEFHKNMREKYRNKSSAATPPTAKKSANTGSLLNTITDMLPEEIREVTDNVADFLDEASELAHTVANDIYRNTRAHLPVELTPKEKLIEKVKEFKNDRHTGLRNMANYTAADDTSHIVYIKHEVKERANPLQTVISKTIPSLFNSVSSFFHSSKTDHKTVRAPENGRNPLIDDFYQQVANWGHNPSDEDYTNATKLLSQYQESLLVTNAEKSQQHDANGGMMTP